MRIGLINAPQTARNTMIKAIIAYVKELLA